MDRRDLPLAPLRAFEAAARTAGFSAAAGWQVEHRPVCRQPSEPASLSAAKCQ